jgi:hypothetical protein
MQKMENIKNFTNRPKTKWLCLSAIIIIIAIIGAGIICINNRSKVLQSNQNSNKSIQTPSPAVKRPVLTLAGEYTKEGEYYSYSKVFVSGDYAYMTEGPEINIYDISNPAEPKLVGKYVRPEPLIHGQPLIEHVFVSGNYAYLSATDNFQILDIADKTEPKLVGTYNENELFCEESYVLGKYAYIASGDLRVLDVSDPAKPFLVSKHRPKPINSDLYPTASAVFLEKDRMYILDNASGLTVENISDPKKIQFLGSYYASNSQNFFVQDNYTYIVREQDDGNVIEILDISQPNNPVLVKSYKDLKKAGDIFVSDGYAYIMNNGSEMNIIDISDPANPVLTKKYDIEYVNDITGTDNYLYLATQRGFKIYKIDYE